MSITNAMNADLTLESLRDAMESLGPAPKPMTIVVWELAPAGKAVCADVEGRTYYVVTPTDMQAVERCTETSAPMFNSNRLLGTYAPGLFGVPVIAFDDAPEKVQLALCLWLARERGLLEPRP